MTEPPEEQRIAPVRVRIDTRRFARILIGLCVGAELLFVLLDYHVNFGRLTDIGRLRGFTNIANEGSLASWFGWTQTLGVALTLWLIYLGARQREPLRWRRRGWAILAGFFTFMAVDDGAQVHETVGTVANHVGDLNLPSFAWQFVVLPLFIGLGVFSLVFLWRVLEQRQSRWIVLAALSCFALAVGLDFIEGLDRDHPWNVHDWLTESVDFGDYTEYRFRASAYETSQHFARAVEEFLEMLGNTLLWYVFLGHLPQALGELHVRFTRR